MREPSSAAEKLFFTTMRVECSVTGGTSHGTGFVIAVATADGDAPIVLVTNKHVVAGATVINVIAPAATADGQKPAYGRKAVGIADPAGFVGHPDSQIDVAATLLTGMPLATTEQPFLRVLPAESSIRRWTSTLWTPSSR
jgi:hypothetical protein